ncbi:nitrate- and nitrite sensing domain-containing protein [Streptomyces sp. NPDC047130]|uniref:sensor histidine kinase n=1 Tax=Streptomyces sp. NPDC047130 TaxID=3155261 RepID=UPI0033F24116
MRTSPRTDGTGRGTPPPPVRGRRAHAGPPADETAEELAAAAAATAASAGRGALGGPVAARGLRLRPRTVRAKVVSLLMVPVMSLLALWGYATVTTVQDVAALRQAERVDAQVRVPAAEAVVALQAERAFALRHATGGEAAPRGESGALADATDRAVGKLRLGRAGTVADSGELPPEVPARLRGFLAGADALSSVRGALLEGDAGWKDTYRAYTDVIADALAVDGALTSIPHVREGSDARILLELGRAGEALAQEDALLASARLDGSLDGERRALFTAATATRRALVDHAAPDLREPQRGAWRELVRDGGHEELVEAEDAVLRAGSGEAAAGAVPAADWEAAHAQVQDALRDIADHASHADPAGAGPLTRGLISPAGGAVLLGLLAVSVSLLISVRIGRGIVADLVGLRNGALEIARRKLPQAMRKLRAGEEIDVDAEAPHGPPAEDETGQVAEALGTVHRAALRAAVERAELASGISGVFVNLARRSQVLVHRQLALLDGMERRAEDPDELSDLFRLDHLTTRMRRHAESLIILSGAAPGRAWSRPVSLTNVVRAAVSEIEDYARVDVRQLAETAVTGAAVADLTHLLAELVENAAQFSPPHTKVRVTGETVGNGYAVEVEDRGLGMGPETLAEANRRIEQSEALDLFDSDRLGLFVVSRLAARHGIKVHLRPSPYGGTTAVVLLPKNLLHAEADPGDAGRPGGADDRGTDRGAALPAAAGARPVLTAQAGPAEELPPADPPPGVTALRPRRAAPAPREAGPATGPFRPGDGATPDTTRPSPVPRHTGTRDPLGTAPDRRGAATAAAAERRGAGHDRAEAIADRRGVDSGRLGTGHDGAGAGAGATADRFGAGDQRPGVTADRLGTAHGRPGTADDPLGTAHDRTASAGGPAVTTPDGTAPVTGAPVGHDSPPGGRAPAAPPAFGGGAATPDASVPYSTTGSPGGPAPSATPGFPGASAPAGATPHPGPRPEAPGPATGPGAPVGPGTGPGRPGGPASGLGTASGPGAPVGPGTATGRPGGHATGPGTTGPGTAAGTGPAGAPLPRRVRQRHLVPQLRQRPPASAAPAPAPAEDRTPEAVRDRMAAYRDGWVRGGGHPPGRGPGTPGRPDSSEGDPA